MLHPRDERLLLPVKQATLLDTLAPAQPFAPVEAMAIRRAASARH